MTGNSNTTPDTMRYIIHFESFPLPVCVCVCVIPVFQFNHSVSQLLSSFVTLIDARFTGITPFSNIRATIARLNARMSIEQHSIETKENN